MDNKVIMKLSEAACKNEAVSRFFGSPTVPGEWFDDEIFGEGQLRRTGEVACGVIILAAIVLSGFSIPLPL